tara:strand:- start:675 stop:1334 length:660 start_codon:yes stop_codon:yes gene_type:complete
MLAKYNHPLTIVLGDVNENSCPNYLNFHCHSTYSDGSLTPIELYNQANKLKLQHLAITDHHSVNSYHELKNYLSNQHYPVIQNTIIWSGVEITGLLKNCLVHILALGFDYQSLYMSPYLTGDSVSGKLLKAENIVSSINKAGGLSFLAHPARYRIGFNELIEEAYKTNFDGIEVWYDYERSSNWRPSPFICSQINNQVNSLNMLKTCGTDTHGLSIMRR